MADERQTPDWRVTIETIGLRRTFMVRGDDPVPLAAIAREVALLRRVLAESGHPDVSDSAARGRFDPDATIGRSPAISGVFAERLPEAVRLHMAVCRCPGRGPCEPHTGKADGSGCEGHGYFDGYFDGTELEPVEPEKVSAILNAWDSGWRPKDGPQPVEPDELARERAEQLVGALTVAIRAWLPSDMSVTVTNPETMARALLKHPWVRKALEPAEAVVFADPLGTIVSFSYPDSVTPTKATHVRVRLEQGREVGSDDIGRQVAVVK